MSAAPAAVQRGLLGDQRQAEAGARPARGPAAAEAVEDGGPFLGRHAGAVVVHRDQDVRAVDLHRRPGCGAPRSGAGRW